MITLKKTTSFKVYGKDIRRERYSKDLSLKKVAFLMTERGFMYYAVKLHRLEKTFEFELPASEMLALLSVLDVSFHIS